MRGKKIEFTYVTVLLVCVLLLTAGCTAGSSGEIGEKTGLFTTVNNNIPFFTEEEIVTKSFESYSELDMLGRCGVAVACVGKDIMPTRERGAIGQIKPAGWQIAKYDFIDGKYLYNRSHLIAYQLTGENANEKNLITGTRHMNAEGMVPFENMVAEYVKSSGNHVMYRVTPIFTGDNLIADGVQIEAYSVEDNGKGVSFNVIIPNIQPGIEINYLDGTSRLKNEEPSKNQSYILNNGTKRFHFIYCPSGQDIKEKNKEKYNGTRESLIKRGYKPCGECNP